MKRDPNQPRLEPRQRICDFPGCSAPGIFGFGAFGDHPGMAACDAHKDPVEQAELADREARRLRVEARNKEAMKPKQGDLLNAGDE